MTDMNEQMKNLIRMLQSPKPSTRYESCELLRVAPEITTEAITALQNATRDPDASIAEAARNALTVHTTAPKPSLHKPGVPAKQNPQITEAKKAYRWLWLSPVLTIPSLLIIYLITFEIYASILLPALWHLLLLQYANKRKSDFVLWHGRQALGLAGIRTAIPFLVVLSGGEDALTNSAWPILFQLAVYFIGNIWGQNQVIRGDCWLKRWRGHGEGLPLPTQIEDLNRIQSQTTSLPIESSMDVASQSQQNFNTARNQILEELHGKDAARQLNAIRELETYNFSSKAILLQLEKLALGKNEEVSTAALKALSLETSQAVAAHIFGLDKNERQLILHEINQWMANGLIESRQAEVMRRRYDFDSLPSTPIKASVIPQELPKEKKIAETVPALPEIARPQPAPVAVAPPKLAAIPKPVAPPKTKRPPVNWKKVITEAATSGALLRGLLYLGAFMIVVSATVLVIRFWSNFNTVLQLLFIAAIPLTFYLSGWFLRARLKLPQAGSVLTGIGAVLVAVDFAAIYQFGGLADQVNGSVYGMFVAVFCTALYAFTAWRLQGEFFDYLSLIGGASIVFALTSLLGLALEWSLVSVAASSAVMVYFAGRNSMAKGMRGDLARAARYLPQILIPASLVFLMFSPAEPPIAHAIGLLLATLAYAILAWRFPSIVFAYAALAASLVTVIFGLDVADLALEWYATVSAILALVYFLLGRGISKRKAESTIIQKYGNALNTTAQILIGLSILGAVFVSRSNYWSSVIALTLSSLDLALCAVLLGNARYTLIAAGLFIAPFTLAIGRWLAAARVIQYLNWTAAAEQALAFAYIGLAIITGRSKKHSGPLYLWAHFLIPITLLILAFGRGGRDWSHTPALLAIGIAITSYLVSFLWMDSGRAASLAGLAAWLPKFGIGKSIFLWPVALLVPIWTATAWYGAGLSPAWLGATLAGIGLAYIGAGQWLFKHAWEYRNPFHVFTYLLCGIGIITAHTNQVALLTTLFVTVVSAGILAWLYNRVVETILASLLFIWPFQILLDVFKVPTYTQTLGYVLFAGLGYIPLAIYLNKFPKCRERLHSTTVFAAGYALTTYAVIASIVGRASETYIPWIGTAVPLIATALFTFSAWYFQTKKFSSAWAWMSALAFAIAFGQALTLFEVPADYDALAWVGLAAVYMLTEQGLRFRPQKSPWSESFHQPLILFALGLAALGLTLSLPGTLTAFGGSQLADYLPPILAQGLLVILAITSALLYKMHWPLFLEPFIAVLPATLFFIGYGERIFGRPLTTPQYALPCTGLGVIHFLAAVFTDRAKIRHAHGLHLGGSILLTWAVLWSLSESQILAWTLGIWTLAAVGSAVLVRYNKHRTWIEVVNLLVGTSEGLLRTLLKNIFQWVAAWTFPVWCVVLLRAINVSENFQWLGLAAPPLLYLGLVLWFRKIDRAYTQPLFTASQFYAALSLFISLPNSLKYLGGDYYVETTPPTGLPAFVILQFLVVAFYAACAWIYQRRGFAHAASWLVFLPYTLAWITHDQTLNTYKFVLPWLGLATTLLVIGFALDKKKVRYSHGPYLAGYFLAIFALGWSTLERVTNIQALAGTILLAILSHLVVHSGRHHCFENFIAFFWKKADETIRQGVSTVFLFFSAYAFPILLTQILANRDLSLAWRGVSLALAAPLYVAIGLLLRRSKPRGALAPRPIWALYSAGYALTAIGAMVAFEDLRLATFVLALNAVVYGISAYIFQQSFWLYLSNVLIPIIGILILQQTDRHGAGWIAGMFMALAFIYIGIGQLFDRLKKVVSAEIHPFAVPFYAPAFLLSAIALAAASGERTLAIQTYSAGVILYALAGWLFREGLFIYPAAWLAAVPYFLAITLTPLDIKWYGLVWLPLILLYIGLGRFAFHRQPLPPIGQGRLAQWFAHPATPFYILAYALSVSMVSLSYRDPLTLTLAFATAAILYLGSAFLFRTSGWIYAGLFTAHMALLTSFTIHPKGGEAYLLSYPFHAVTWLMALTGYGFGRRSSQPARTTDKAFRFTLLERLFSDSWARPFLVFATIDILLWQTIALYGYTTTIMLAIGHMLLLALFAILWTEGALVYGVVGFGLLAVGAALKQAEVPFPDAVAAIGGIGFGVYLLGVFLERIASRVRPLSVWPRPLTHAAIFLTAAAVAVNFTQVFADMTAAAASLAFAGALYVTIAYRGRFHTLGYFGMALLEIAWVLALVMNDITQPQYYALPGGIYFLGVSYLELRRNRKRYAVALEILGLGILLVTSFTQSLNGARGFPYFVILLVESLLVIWWGTIQKRKIPFLTGIGASAINLVAQVIVLVNVYNISIWLVAFGAGLLIMGIAIYIERGRGKLRARSREWSEELEQWE